LLSEIPENSEIIIPTKAEIAAENNME